MPHSVRDAFLEMLTKNKQDLANILSLIEGETGNLHPYARSVTSIFILSDNILVALIAYDELIQIARQTPQFRIDPGNCSPCEFSAGKGRA